MFEWLDGYWTAMRHVAAVKVPVDQSPSVTEWLAGIGSIGAAIAAAIAAWLSWSAAHQSRQMTTEIERGNVIKEALLTRNEAIEKANDISNLIGQLKARDLGHDTPAVSATLIFELDKDLHRYLKSGERANELMNKALAAKGVRQLGTIKRELLNNQASVRELDRSALERCNKFNKMGVFY